MIMKYDDSKEPIPSTVGGGGEWDGNDDGLSSTEDSYVDEEEVKKCWRGGGGIGIYHIDDIYGISNVREPRWYMC